MSLFQRCPLREVPLFVCVHSYMHTCIHMHTQVGVKLFKEKERTTVKKGRKKSSSIEQSSQSSALAAEKTSVDAQREPLLEVKLRSLKSEVFDRKWDSRGSVSMKEVSIKDYITKGGWVGGSHEWAGSGWLYQHVSIFCNPLMIRCRWEAHRPAAD